MGSLSETLSRRRKEMGLTLLQIAEAMGVSEATVQRWESGNIKTLRYAKIGRLADILQVTPAALMGWENPDTPTGKREPTAQAGSGFTQEQAELIRLFQAASPEIRAAALAVLRSAEAADKARDGNKEGK